jgi:hypothetical protein
VASNVLVALKITREDLLVPQKENQNQEQALP